MASGVRVVGGSRAAKVRPESSAVTGPAADADVVDRSPLDAGTGREPMDGATVDGDAIGGEVVYDGIVRQTVDAESIDGARGDKSRSAPWRRRRAGLVALAVLAVLGVAGTVSFGLAWQGLHATQSGEAQARATARSFLVDLTNFNAKTVDADFSAVSSMATGSFATQAQRFFNSAIRQDLQKALASSRGQIRALYVQSYGAGSATVYSVVDQLYVNNKLTSPQTDVLRIVVDLSQVAGRWKVADVTVLQGPELGSATTSPGTSSTGSPGTSSTGSPGTSSTGSPGSPATSAGG